MRFFTTYGKINQLVYKQWWNVITFNQVSNPAILKSADKGEPQRASARSVLYRQQPHLKTPRSHYKRLTLLKPDGVERFSKRSPVPHGCGKQVQIINRIDDDAQELIGRLLQQKISLQKADSA